MDRLTPEDRSANMARIRATNTVPELRVRRFLHARGFRFRLHASLPGTPDVVLPKHRTVVFVHGCFWHQHPGCRYAYKPRTRVSFWSKKFEGTRERDERAMAKLEALGWQVLVVWECQTRADALLTDSLSSLLNKGETILP